MKSLHLICAEAGSSLWVSDLPKFKIATFRHSWKCKLIFYKYFFYCENSNSFKFWLTKEELCELVWTWLLFYFVCGREWKEKENLRQETAWYFLSRNTLPIKIKTPKFENFFKNNQKEKILIKRRFVSKTESFLFEKN